MSKQFDRPFSDGEKRGLKLAANILRRHVPHYEKLPYVCNAATAVGSMADKIDQIADDPKQRIGAGVKINE